MRSTKTRPVVHLRLGFWETACHRSLHGEGIRATTQPGDTTCQSCRRALTKIRKAFAALPPTVVDPQITTSAQWRSEHVQWYLSNPFSTVPRGTAGAPLLTRELWILRMLRQMEALGPEQALVNLMQAFHDTIDKIPPTMRGLIPFPGLVEPGQRVYPGDPNQN